MDTAREWNQALTMLVIAWLLISIPCQLTAAETPYPGHPHIARLNQLAEQNRPGALKSAYKALETQPLNDIYRLKLMEFIAVQENIANKYAPSLAIINEAMPLAQAQEQYPLLSRLNSLAGLAYYKYGEIIKSIQHLDRAQQIAEQHGDTPGIIRARINKAVVYRNGYQDPITALQLDLDTLNIAREMQANRAVSYLLNNLAQNFLDIGAIELALQFATESLSLKKAIGDKTSIATSYRVLTLIYNKMGMPEQAWQAVAEANSLVDSGSLPIRTARIYLAKAETLQSLDKSEPAENSYLQAAALFAASGDKLHLLHSSLQLIEFYLQKGEPELAAGWIKQSQELLEATPDLRLKFEIQHVSQRARLLLAAGELLQAQDLLVSAAAATPAQTSDEQLANLYQLLATTEASLGKHNDAYFHQQRASELKQRSDKLKQQQLSASLQAVYATYEQRNQRGISQRQELIAKRDAARAEFRIKERVYLFVILLIAACFIGYHFYRRYRVTSRVISDKRYFRDELTQLHNKRYVTTLIPKLLRDDRDASTSIKYSILLIDIDDFDSYNRHYGLDAGNEVLQKLAQLLRQHFRDDDVLIRWGGEEFVIICRDVAVGETNDRAERFRQGLKALQLSTQTTISCSIGMVHSKSTQLSSSPGSTWIDLLHLADLCLYAAKNSGKDAWVGVDIAAWKKGSRFLLNLFSDSPEYCISYGNLKLTSSLEDSRELVWKLPIEQERKSA